MKHHRSIPKFIALLIILPTFTLSAQDVFLKPLADPLHHLEFTKTSQKLKSVNVLRSDFRQTKRIVILKNPLISSGRFIFSRKKGIYWQVSEPFQTAFILGPRQIKRKNAGEKALVIEAKDQPIIYEFSQMFFSVFSGDANELMNNFQIFYQGNAAKWEIGLIPKNVMLKKMIARLLLKGGDNIQSVFILEQSKDSTEIKFINLKKQSGALSKSEELLFE